MDHIILRSKKGNLSIDPELKRVVVKGLWGSVSKNFNGTDIDYIDNKLFIKSKQSFQALKNYFINYNHTVNYGYFVRLNLIGLGFRFLKINDYILIKAGHSHYVKMSIPKGLHIVGFKRRFFIFGIDKNQVHNFANLIRLQRKPDSYKGKGILFEGEKISLKVGKQK